MQTLAPEALGRAEIQACKEPTHRQCGVLSVKSNLQDQMGIYGIFSPVSYSFL
jgi:hypothetical protein